MDFNLILTTTICIWCNILWLNILDVNVGTSFGRDLCDLYLGSECTDTGNENTVKISYMFTFSESV